MVPPEAGSTRSLSFSFRVQEGRALETVVGVRWQTNSGTGGEVGAHTKGGCDAASGDGDSCHEVTGPAGSLIQYSGSVSRDQHARAGCRVRRKRKNLVFGETRAGDEGMITSRYKCITAGAITTGLNSQTGLDRLSLGSRPHARSTLTS